MYVPNQCVIHNIFDYPIRYCIFVISLHLVLYFHIGHQIASYQRLGTKLRLVIMFKNEIIGTVIVEITKDLIGIRLWLCGC